MKKYKTVLTIAGSDSSGGAGIQADIKTITFFKCYAMSVITALTAQNTQEVKSIFNTTPKFIREQLNTTCNDIKPDSIKIGMLSDKKIIQEISKFLENSKISNVILDPVMVSTSGFLLLKKSAISSLVKNLITKSLIITPNLKEAELLTNSKINTKNDMIKAIEILQNIGAKNILIKGLIKEKKIYDCLFLKKNKEIHFFMSNIINSKNTHGTGCTLSSAIASNIALGNDILKSVKISRNYIKKAIYKGCFYKIGKGSGPVYHF